MIVSKSITLKTVFFELYTAKKSALNDIKSHNTSSSCAVDSTLCGNFPLNLQTATHSKADICCATQLEKISFLITVHSSQSIHGKIRGKFVAIISEN